MERQKPLKPQLGEKGIIENGLAFRSIDSRRKIDLDSLLRRTSQQGISLTSEMEGIVLRIDQIKDPTELRKYSVNPNMFIRCAIAFSLLAGKQIREDLTSDENPTVRYIASIPISQLRYVRDDLTTLGMSLVGAIKKMTNLDQKGMRDFLKEVHSTARSESRQKRRPS